MNSSNFTTHPTRTIAASPTSCVTSPGITPSHPVSTLGTSKEDRRSLTIQSSPSSEKSMPNTAPGHSSELTLNLVSLTKTLVALKTLPHRKIDMKVKMNFS